MKDSRNKFVLITRPKEDSLQVEKILTERGIASLSAPLLSIEYINPADPISEWLNSCQALIMTSANGVRALMHQKQYTDAALKLPLYAVGDATAREAEILGFSDINTASGDVDGLADLVAEKLKPENGPLLHVAGSKVAGDLAGFLENKNFTIHRAVCYHSTKATELSIDTLEALVHERVRAILFYSPRTAESFSNLVEKAKLSQTLCNVDAVCLSQNVAIKLNDLPWRKVLIAEQPTQSDLLTQLDKTMADTKNSEAQSATDVSLENYTAEDIIEAFGGIRPMAHKLNIAVSTVQGWKSRNHIPDAKSYDVKKAILAENIELPEPSISKNIEGDEATVTIEMEPNKGDAAVQEDETPAPPSKNISVFSLIGIPALAVAVLFQPYWGPTVEKKLNPFVSKFAPNLAAAKSQNGNDAVITPPVDLNPINDRLAHIEKELEKAPEVGDAVLISLQNQITDMTSTVSDLQAESNKRPLLSESADGSNIDLSPLQTQLDQLKNKLASIEQLQSNIDTVVEQQTTPLLEQISQQQDQLNKLAAQRIPVANNATSVALLISVMEISNALQKGQSITPMLGRLKDITSEQDELIEANDKLEALAASNIPTFQQLHKEFSILAANPDAPKVDATSDEWIEATLSNLQGLVSIRRVGEGEDLPPISQAEVALSRYDLDGAIKILDSIKGERSDVNDWLIRADKLNQAELNLTKIRQVASQMLLAGGNS